MNRGRRIVVGYARTTGHEEGEAADPALVMKGQVESIQAFARGRGMLLVKMYLDRGIPKQPRSTRTGIFALLDEVPLLHTTDVVVSKAERIIREGEIGRQILKELDDNSIRIQSVSEELAKVREDTKRITSSTVAALKSASTKIRALKQGKSPAGRAPMGYKRDSQNGDTSRLVVVEAEAQIVTWIFEEYLRQRSISRVAEALNERRVAAPYGTLWSRASVAWILRNEVYVGTVKFGAVKAKGEHTPLISPAVFERAQELRRQNRRNGRTETLDTGEPMAVDVPRRADSDEAEEERGSAEEGRARDSASHTGHTGAPLRYKT